MAEKSAEPRDPGDRPIAYDARSEARRLSRVIRAGALATLGPDGAPFSSLVNVATGFDGAPLLLTSRLSLHTRYLEADPRASLLLAQGGRGDPLAHPRLTISGVFSRTDCGAARARFLARHPKSRLYADFPDFSFWRMAPARCHLNGGFARAADFDWETLRADVAGAGDLAEAEAGALARMNEDHREALALYATRLAGEKPGPWRATGLDPEGMDLLCGDRTARVAFPEAVTDANGLRRVLARLAIEARAAAT